MDSSTFKLLSRIIIIIVDAVTISLQYEFNF